MLTPIHAPEKGKLRVVGYASGSGNTLWKAYELQRQLEETAEGSPFEIVGLFCDSPEAACMKTAEQYGIPSAAIDIRAFYKQREQPLKNREVRREYDREALALIEPFGADLILLAGYVWATTDEVLDHYTLINVHPADLSIMRDGRRAYAGGNGVGDALAAGEPFLCCTSHVATKELDAGPILIISERVPVDYSLHPDEDSRFRHYLKLVNEQNRLVGARTLLEIALGHFATDANGLMYYRGRRVPDGLRIENWRQNLPIFERETEKLMCPNAVAVIGASNKPGIGNAIMQNMVRGGFEGSLYAINPRAEAVLGITGYATVADIPGEVDLAVLAIPASAVLAVAEQCGQKGVKALICITAGFKEVGNEADEQALLDIVNRYNMRMIGPNCMGLMNASHKLNATILTGEIAKGGIALVTQSGAIGAGMLDFAEELGIGFSSIISLGNQSDVNACDLLPLLDQDPQTRVVLMYLESIADPVRFCAIAARMRKPVVVLKSGRTVAGASAASSHTGSLAGNDQIVSALLAKAGILRVETMQDGFLAATALSLMPQLNGKRVGLLTNAGGPGILISDAVTQAGFELSPLPPTLRETLAPQLMKEASIHNPIDLVATAPPAHYPIAAKAMLDSGAFDALLVCCVPPATIDTAEVAEAIAPVLKTAAIPVLTCFFGPTLGSGARAVMHREHIPTVTFPEQLAAALVSLEKQPRFRPAATPPVPLRQVWSAREILCRTAEGAYLSSQDTYALLECFSIAFAPVRLIRQERDLDAFTLTFPVVAKIDHPDIVHKSDVGGVVLNIQDLPALRQTVGKLLAKFLGANGVLVQEMVPAGTEMIVGSASDPQLGKAVMVGLGGTLVEVFKDVAFGYPPLDHPLAMSMIEKLKCLPLLKAYRGKQGSDMDALAQLLTRVSDLLLALPDIAELDLNPVLYDATKGCFVAADARIRRGNA